MLRKTFTHPILFLALCVLLLAIASPATHLASVSAVRLSLAAPAISNSALPALTRSLPAPPRLPRLAPDAIDATWYPITAFSAGAVSDISVTSLGPNKFIVAYSTGTTGAARVGEIKAGFIIFGPEVVFNNAYTIAISVDSITQSSFVLAYSDGGNSFKGTVVLGNVASGENTITFGSEYIFNNDTTGSLSVNHIGVYQFVVAYQDTGNSNHGAAVMGAYSGSSGDTVITLGGEYEFNPAATAFVSVANFYQTGYSKFVIAYRDKGDSERGKVLIGNYTSNVASPLTYGPETTFCNVETSDITITGLTSQRFVVAFRDAYFLTGRARVGQFVSDDEFMLGDLAYFNTGDAYLAGSFGVARTADDGFVVAYKTAANDGRVIPGSVDVNKNITFGSDMYINPGYASERPSIESLYPAPNIFVTCWSDLGDFERGKCRTYGDWPSLYLPLLRK